MMKYTVKQLLSEPKNLDFIKSELAGDVIHTRTSLAKLLCQRLSLIDPGGKAQTANCIRALRHLENRKIIKLPAAKISHKNRNSVIRLNESVSEPLLVPDSVEKIDNIEFILIKSEDNKLRKIWNELMIVEHPQGKRKIVGRQLRYLIKSEHGWLGGASFSCAAICLEDRDKWFGWDTQTRTAYLPYVLNMSRFLIRNSVKCKNLASFCISKLLKRVSADFFRMYSYYPWVVESFVDTEQFDGVCYKASNWKLIGKTKGRGRNDRYTKKNESVKDIYIYVLDDHFRKHAGLPPEPVNEIKPIDIIYGLESDKWAENEFGEAKLGDKRLTDRLIKIADDKTQSPGESYLKAVNGHRYDVKSYYGFLGNNDKEISFDSILEPHMNRTLQRAKSEQTVYAVQDSSDLNYKGLKKCNNLGLIGKLKNSKGTKGLRLHNTLMVNEDGLPLGLGFEKCYAPELVDKKIQRSTLPIEKKESFRWLESYRKTIEFAVLCSETQFITVADRECDIFDIYRENQLTRNKVPFVIRAQHNRKLEGTDSKLFELLQESENKSKRTVRIPAQTANDSVNPDKVRVGIPEREAILTVSYEKVTIKPPKLKHKRNWDNIELYAVYAREENPPEGAKRISWKILTSLPVLSVEDAYNIIRIYKKRWIIEEFHRVLKTGCNVEKHRQTTAERLKRIIAVDMVIAWRIMLITLIARKRPETPYEEVFSKTECEMIDIIQAVNKKKDYKHC